MKIAQLDHLVLTVADIDKTIDFYTRVLGMESIAFGKGRRALRFGNQKINLHEQGKEIKPNAANANTGSADLCFLTTMEMDLIIARLKAASVEIIQGPVSRSGATGELLSVYFRDPDQNLIELSNPANPQKVIDKLAYILIKDGKILVTKSKGKDTYYLPGGKRDPGENDAEALIREVEEELSVALLPQTIQYLGTFSAQAHGHTTGVLVKMTCYEAEYRGVLEAASEIEELRWLNYTGIELVSYVDKIIFEHLKNAGRLL